MEKSALKTNSNNSIYAAKSVSKSALALGSFILFSFYSPVFLDLNQHHKDWNIGASDNLFR